MERELLAVFESAMPLSEMTDEELGGADVHTRESGVADHYAQNDHHALKLARRAVSRLNRVKRIELDLAEGTTEATVKEMCEKLLANTVIESYRIEI